MLYCPQTLFHTYVQKMLCSLLCRSMNFITFWPRFCFTCAKHSVKLTRFITYVQVHFHLALQSQFMPQLML